MRHAARLMRAGWLCLAASLAHAQDDPLQGLPSRTAAYRQIDDARAQLSRTLDAQEAACDDVFAVFACRARVQEQRRAGLNELRRQEAVLHDAERVQRSREQVLHLQDKARERALEEQAAQAQAQEAAQRASDARQHRLDHARSEDGAAQPASAAVPVSGPDAAEQARNRAAFERKRDDAEQHRKEVARRVQEEARKAIAPLPDNP